MVSTNSQYENSQLDKFTINFLKAHGLGIFSKNYDKKINESIFTSDDVDGIVALEKGNVLGYASIHYIKKITRKSGIIEDVVVKENQRGKGIGKLLVNNLIEKAKKNNCDKIILSSSEKNLKFYQKLGFQKNEFEMILRI